MLGKITNTFTFISQTLIFTIKMKQTMFYLMNIFCHRNGMTHIPLLQLLCFYHQVNGRSSQIQYFNGSTTTLLLALSVSTGTLFAHIYSFQEEKRKEGDVRRDLMHKK